MNQTGGRKHISAIETAIINELIIEYHIITRQPLYTHQDDAVACYDRIVINNVILSSRKYLIPNNVCKVINLAPKKMVYKTQSQSHTSKRSHSHTNDLPFHGGGQGSCNRGTLWNFISIPLMEVIDKLTPSCTIKPPSSDKIWKLKMFGFVDDRKHYVNLILQHIKKSLEKAISKSLNMWDELLSFVGGKLEMSKCGFYVLQ